MKCRSGGDVLEGRAPVYLGRVAPGIRLYGEPCGALLPDRQALQMSKSLSTWLFQRSPAGTVPGSDEAMQHNRLYSRHDSILWGVGSTCSG